MTLVVKRTEKPGSKFDTDIILSTFQLVREDLWRKSSVQLFTTNKLPHSVLMSLCKKKYNFNLTNQVLLAINEGKTVERQKIERPKHYTVKLEVDGEWPVTKLY